MSKIKVVATFTNTFDMQPGGSLEEAQESWTESLQEDPMSFVDSTDVVMEVTIEAVDE